MKMIHKDVKAIFEKITNINAYPSFVPLEAELPALAYRMENLSRNQDSDQSNNNISEHEYVLFVVGDDHSNVITLTQKLIDELDGSGFKQNKTNILVVDVISVSDDFDQDQQTYIQCLNINLTVSED